MCGGVGSPTLVGMRIPRLPKLLPLVAAAVLAAPAASAGAQTICVNATGCDKDANGSLPGALAIAKALGGPDVVRIGANEGTPYTGPFSYAPGADSANSVTIQSVGAGRPLLSTLEDQPGTVLDLDDATVKGVEVQVPRADGLGLELSNSTDEDVAVTRGGSNSDVGIETRGSVRLDRTSVDIEGSNAVINRGTLTADRLTTKGEFLFTGVRDINASTTLVTRSRTEERSFPLAAGSGGARSCAAPSS